MQFPEGLENTAAQLEALCRPLTVSQAQFRPTPSTWSVDECVEHLVTTDRFTMISIRRALKADLASQAEQMEVAGKSEFLQQRMPSRLRKVQAPPQAQPTGRYGEWPQSLAEFQTARQDLLDLAASADATWEGKLSPHPLLGNFSASQWLIFSATHTQRHLSQIEEVLAHPDFPKA